MNKGIDYTIYNITCTSQFDDGLATLKKNGCSSEIKKLFRIIDEIISDEDMFEKEYSRPLKNTPKVQHIHLDGRQTGDIILLYTVDGKDIDLDLKLHNISDHKNLDRYSNKKFINRQILHDFDVIQNKFSHDQQDYAEECYLNLISDYKFHQLRGEKRSSFTEKYLQEYLDNFPCVDTLDYDELLQLMNYFEHIHQKSIFGSLNFDYNLHCTPITQREIDYILDLVDEYNLSFRNSYIETEVDEYGDTYESMYVEIISEDFRSSKLFECELYSLKDLFNIGFNSKKNGLGRFGKTYEFFHYFE